MSEKKDPLFEVQKIPLAVNVQVDVPPGPGIYRDYPEADYHRLPYCSSSRLTTLANSSMLHVMFEMDNPRTPSPQMAVGSALHAALLQPEKLDAEFIESPHKDFKTKVAQEWRAEKEAAGLRILTGDQMDLVLAMRSAAHEHMAASLLLKRRTDTELTVVWDDEATGIRCKARIDFLSDLMDLPIIGDVKTTISATAEDFSRSIFLYGYHRQIAHYRRGLMAHGIEPESACIIAIENTKPCGVQVFRLMERIIERGDEENKRLLQRWKANWSYPEDIQDISMPEWAMKKTL